MTRLRSSLIEATHSPVFTLSYLRHRAQPHTIALTSQRFPVLSSISIEAIPTTTEAPLWTLSLHFPQLCPRTPGLEIPCRCRASWLEIAQASSLLVMQI